MATPRRVTINPDWWLVLNDFANEFGKTVKQVLHDLLETSSLDNLRAEYEDERYEVDGRGER